MKQTLLSIAVLSILSGCSTPSSRNARPVVLSAEVRDLSTEDQLLNLHNQVRRSHGLGALEIDPHLAAYAQNWAETMAGQCSLAHSGLSFMQGSGFLTGAENIAFNQGSTTHVMQSWLNSAGHRKNILTRQFRVVGFGIARNASGQPYLSAVFGG